MKGILYYPPWPDRLDASAAKPTARLERHGERQDPRTERQRRHSTALSVPPTHADLMTVGCCTSHAQGTCGCSTASQADWRWSGVLASTYYCRYIHPLPRIDERLANYCPHCSPLAAADALRPHLACLCLPVPAGLPCPCLSRLAAAAAPRPLPRPGGSEVPMNPNRSAAVVASKGGSSRILILARPRRGQQP